MTKRICEVCEEETTCEYLNEYEWHTACCDCDDSIEINKRCSSCFSDYASNIYDNYKDLQRSKKEKTVHITGVKND